MEMRRGRTYVRFRQFGDQLLLVGKRLLRLPGADEGVYEAWEVLLDPGQAPVELAELPRGHDDEPIALLGEFDERIVRPRDWRRNVDVVCLPKLFDLADCLVGVPPVRVLRPSWWVSGSIPKILAAQQTIQ